ncbi:hypothetical protein XENOCAPTIV_029016, partial [Xenoophorus captivus]
GDSGNAGGNRKDKSLRIMSQKFVMLFLVSKTQTVTLDAAAKVLIEESRDSSSHSKYKSKKARAMMHHALLAPSSNIVQSCFALTHLMTLAKVRRLYDIANVLTSLELIRKVHVREERARKPAFNRLSVSLYAQLSHSSTSSLAPTSTHPTVLAAQPHPEHLLIPSPHCLAYLPSLSQPSVVMLYKAPEQQEWAPAGQRSAKTESEEEGKRSWEENEQEVAVVTKKSKSGLEKSEKVRGCFVMSWLNPKNLSEKAVVYHLLNL